MIIKIKNSITLISFTISLICILLCFWQVKRLHWKNNLIQNMERAYNSLKINADFVIVDGINIPKISTKVKAIKNGDNKSISIASASIIAKVVRDNLMKKLSNKYPDFFWNKNLTLSLNKVMPKKFIPSL